MKTSLAAAVVSFLMAALMYYYLTVDRRMPRAVRAVGVALLWLNMGSALLNLFFAIKEGLA